MMDLVTHEAEPWCSSFSRSTSATRAARASPSARRARVDDRAGGGASRPGGGRGRALRVNRGILDATIAASGTIYPYGSFPLEPADWAALHGDGFAAYAARKRTYDPKGILNPSIGVGRAALAAGAR